MLRSVVIAGSLVVLSRLARAEPNGGAHVDRAVDGAADVWLDLFRPHSEPPWLGRPLGESDAETPPVWRQFRQALMQGRTTSGLYLLGDDRLHVVPRRLGLLGWGLAAGGTF